MLRIRSLCSCGLAGKPCSLSVSSSPGRPLRCFASGGGQTAVWPLMATMFSTYGSSTWVGNGQPSARKHANSALLANATITLSGPVSNGAWVRRRSSSRHSEMVAPERSSRAYNGRWLASSRNSKSTCQIVRKRRRQSVDDAPELADIIVVLVVHDDVCKAALEQLLEALLRPGRLYVDVLRGFDVVVALVWVPHHLHPSGLRQLRSFTFGAPRRKVDFLRHRP